MEQVRELKNESGQATVEYILLLAIVVSLYVTLLKGLTQSGVMTTMQKQFTETFAYTYRYGHPKARGQDDGGPVNIPQYVKSAAPDGGDQNFRIFINPPISP